MSGSWMVLALASAALGAWGGLRGRSFAVLGALGAGAGLVGAAWGYDLALGGWQGGLSRGAVALAADGWSLVLGGALLVLALASLALGASPARTSIRLLGALLAGMSTDPQGWLAGALLLLAPDLREEGAGWTLAGLGGALLASAGPGGWAWSGISLAWLSRRRSDSAEEALADLGSWPLVMGLGLHRFGEAPDAGLAWLGAALVLVSALRVQGQSPEERAVDWARCGWGAALLGMSAGELGSGWALLLLGVQALVLAMGWAAGSWRRGLGLLWLLPGSLGLLSLLSVAMAAWGAQPLRGLGVGLAVVGLLRIPAGKSAERGWIPAVLLLGGLLALGSSPELLLQYLPALRAPGEAGG